MAGKSNEAVIAVVKKQTDGLIDDMRIVKHTIYGDPEKGTPGLADDVRDIKRVFMGGGRVISILLTAILVSLVGLFFQGCRPPTYQLSPEPIIITATGVPIPPTDTPTPTISPTVTFVPTDTPPATFGIIEITNDGLPETGVYTPYADQYIRACMSLTCKVLGTVARGDHVTVYDVRRDEHGDFWVCRDPLCQAVLAFIVDDIYWGTFAPDRHSRN